MLSIYNAQKQPRSRLQPTVQLPRQSCPDLVYFNANVKWGEGKNPVYLNA